MKVICPGLMKTGTTSLANALRILGYNTYDFEEQVEFFADEFYELFDKGKVPDFYAMFKDVDAITDNPGCLVFEELFECFPDAKVILTVRDEKEWLKSFRSHLTRVVIMARLFYYINYFKVQKVARLITPIHHALIGSENPDSEYVFLKRYRWHNERVQQVIPKDKLLVFNVKQGWKPLCEFLGREVPEEPFPRANVAGQDTQDKMWKLYKVLLKLFLLAAVVVAVFAAVIYRIW